MATSIRLKRVGAKKEASYRIVVIDSREGTSGASVERLGLYNPRTQPSLIRVNAARTLYWLNEGAEPSDTVRSLLKKTGIWKQFHDGVPPEALEDEIVLVGPAAGERGTSQRPMPTDRVAKPAEAPAPKGKKAAAKRAAQESEVEEAAQESEVEEAAAGDETPAGAGDETPAVAEDETSAVAEAEAPPEAEEAPAAEEGDEVDESDEGAEDDEEEKS